MDGMPRDGMPRNDGFPAYLALLDQARRSDEPSEFSPGEMMRLFFPMFTVASGIRPQVMLSLLAEPAPAYHRLVSELRTRIQSNDEFKRTIDPVKEADYIEALNALPVDQLSAKKRPILERAREESSA